MITKFGRLRSGEKFVSVHHGPQDSFGKTIWVKSTETLAHDQDGVERKFDKLDSVYKLKKTSKIPPLFHCVGGEG